MTKKLLEKAAIYWSKKKGKAQKKDPLGQYKKPNAQRGIFLKVADSISSFYTISAIIPNKNINFAKYSSFFWELLQMSIYLQRFLSDCRK
jgi:hypothetical protein